MRTHEQAVDTAVRRALEEDRAFEDLTSRLLVGGRMAGRGAIVARREGIISGQDAAMASFRCLDDSIEYDVVIPDGGKAGAGCEVARMSGRYAAILSAERTALNFLGHLSGIATLTSEYVLRTGDTGIRILDTRKTIPGMRILEKKAVADGGGVNHRPDLASYILVKENHIAAAGGIEAAVEILGRQITDAEIEVSSLKEFNALRPDPPARIMLDNFSPGMIDEAVASMAGWEGRKPEIEVSGGIDLENISSYLIEGVDFISVGRLTSSAPSLDLSLLLEGAV
ncbi:MAG: carboxylating nicotinate-nucleotide diphosphorylase [Candidatus Krumholzibacteriota bacterium]|nr:carboxylating nicotinate-nucleotide diphosphorylase [Candidatus Krumholzibacteriota bacterium]